MGKMKTHKALSKRVKVTASGKIKRYCSGASHLMRTKNAKRRRRLTSPSYLTGTLCKKIKAQLA